MKRFSLKTLLIVVTLAAIVCGFLVPRVFHGCDRSWQVVGLELTDRWMVAAGIVNDERGTELHVWKIKRLETARASVWSWRDVADLTLRSSGVVTQQFPPSPPPPITRLWRKHDEP